MTHTGVMTQTTATVAPAYDATQAIRTGVENLRKMAGSYGLPVDAEFDNCAATVSITGPKDTATLTVTLDGDRMWAQLRVLGHDRPRVVPLAWLGSVLENLKYS